MFKTYFKIAWRTALRNRSFTAISLGSLVLGITLFFLISLWVKDEMGYDDQFVDQEQVCRLESDLIRPDGRVSKTSSVGWPVGNTLKAQYPEIEHLTYLRDWNPIVKLKETRFYEDAMYADEQFFSVFGYQLQEGNPATALKQPYSVVITEDIKEKYFGKEEALGKVLMVNDTIPYNVTGVFAELPTNSHLRFDMIGSFSSICSLNPGMCEEEFADGWFNVNVYNYVRLSKNTTPAATTARIKNLVQVAGKAAVAKSGFKTNISLRSVKDIYLYSGMSTGQGTVGNYKTIRLFLAIGIFILLIACLNFINLSTARSVERAKEIGIQKVLGNDRKRLILQFLTEAAVLCSIAAVISIVLMIALLPVFNAFAGKSFTISSLLTLKNGLLLSGIIVVLVPLAGFYPAWVLSSFKPIKVLKGNFSHTASGALLRKSLVVLQFVISAGFIMCTLIMWKQMKYMQEQDLGFNKDNMLVIDAIKVPWTLRHEKAGVFKSELLRKSGITQMTAAGAIPGRSGWAGQFAYPEGKTKEQATIVEYIATDQDYVKTVGLPLVAGRDFLPNSEADEKEAFIINEAAVKTFGWGSAQNALGKKLTTSGKDGIVVGVLKDYHQHGLQTTINPVVLSPVPFYILFAMRYQDISPAQAVANVKAVWDDVYKGYPLEYRFMDEDFQRQYSKENKLRSFFNIAAGLSVIIGCLGLLGLIIYTTQKRIREIGIRKVLGAGIGGIVALLSVDLLKLVGIAIILAVPIAWWTMHNWLQGFAYRTEISWQVFVLSAAAALFIAMFTISFQAIRAALMNPVKSLGTW
ncbi:FtsX-like permease family protein [Chitinophaga sp. SYP-B3965]|uniref:ABC transporter permease n=1 Tax=Chitinophaga sp. SYP-B3965 TaxID=2663120 RepID=UPI001299958C|nr:ABC transporter permease [Chitinophaga sp. SYP-B3965]MRG44070.1 FtsX-like permease family protein [Chitinophaga sp. SYP-B3965]